MSMYIKNYQFNTLEEANIFFQKYSKVWELAHPSQYNIFWIVNRTIRY